MEITGELKQILERFELKVTYDLELIVTILKRAGKSITPTNVEVVPKVSLSVEYLFHCRDCPISREVKTIRQ